MPGPAVVFREIHRLRRHAQDLQEQIDRVPRQPKARQADLTEQLNEALGKLKEAEVNVPPNVLPQYQRMVGSLGADALAALRGRTCSACHSEITAQNYNELLQELFVVCKSCGRILY